jgi:hypothetical protein
MDPSLAREVRGRARNFCEYCRVPQSCYPTVPFPIDHIIARQHGGSTSIDNLDLSCLHDNTHKGPNIAGLDPQTLRITRLFNPRKDRWERHFAWDGPFLVGRTAVGRTTIVVLAMNHPDAVAVRRSLIAEGRFPTDSRSKHDPLPESRGDIRFRLQAFPWVLASGVSRSGPDSAPKARERHPPPMGVRYSRGHEGSSDPPLERLWSGIDASRDRVEARGRHEPDRRPCRASAPRRCSRDAVAES